MVNKSRFKTMDDVLDEIRALRQEGTVKKYCDEFQFLVELVKNSEEMSEYYAIYLFIDGLEPEIRDVFITWHQYSFHNVKDYISLALKLDANKLSDTLSPYDPESSLYIKDLVFDFRKSIDEIMGKNEVSNEDKLFDGIVHKVFDEMPKKCSNQEDVDSKIQDVVKMSEKISNQEVVNSEIQDLVHFDRCNDIHEKDINVKCINVGNDLCGYLRNDTPRDDQSEDTSNEDMKVEVAVYNPKDSEKQVVKHQVNDLKGLDTVMGSYTVMGHSWSWEKGKGNEQENKQKISKVFNTDCKSGEVVELKFVELVDKNRVWDVGLQLGSDMKVSVCKNIRSEINKLEFVRVDTFEWKPGWKSTLKMGFLFRASWFLSFIWVPLSCYMRIIRPTVGTFEGHTTCVFIVQSITGVAQLVYYGVDSLLKLWTIKATRGRGNFELLMGLHKDINSEAYNNQDGCSLRAKKAGCSVPKMAIRCDSSSSNASSLSALQQLKTSAADRYTKEKSSIMVIGLSIPTPVEIREKLAIPEAEWPRAIKELCALNHIEEAAILCTCNRMEIYVVALSQHRGVKEVTEWMSKTGRIPVFQISDHCFLLYNTDATRHIFQVSAGLESLVLGEGQILAQVKQVAKVSQGVAGFGRNISGLFKHAIMVGKRVRTETRIAEGAVSVSSAAVELALMKLPQSAHSTARCLLIGAGKMGKLVIKHLVSKGCTRIVVVNRSVEKVDALREEFKDIEIIYKPVGDMMTCAGEADVIFTSTSSETPLFLRENVVDLPPVGPDAGGKRLFIDISVPRNVGSCVNEVDNTRAYNVDDLKEVVAANREDRLRKAMEAEAIIAEELKVFEAWRDSLETVPTIRKLRAYAERIRSSDLEKCLQKMGDNANNNAKKAVEALSRGIVNKLLHGPLQHLRYDGTDDRTLDETLENMHALNRMFNLETEVSLLEEKIRAKVEQQK